MGDGVTGGAEGGAGALRAGRRRCCNEPLDGAAARLRGLRGLRGPGCRAGIAGAGIAGARVNTARAAAARLRASLSLLCCCGRRHRAASSWIRSLCKESPLCAGPAAAGHSLWLVNGLSRVVCLKRCFFSLLPRLLTSRSVAFAFRRWLMVPGKAGGLSLHKSIPRSKQALPQQR